MKRLTRKVVIGLLCMLTLSMFGCGSTATSSTDSSSTESTTELSTVTSDGKYTSIENYINSDLVKSQLESSIATYKDQGLDIDVTAEGNNLVYSYTYTDTEILDGMKEALESGMETQADTFINMATELENYIDVSNPGVVLRYYDCNKTLIAERTFTSEG